jgi:hypothetical protein
MTAPQIARGPTQRATVYVVSIVVLCTLFAAFVLGVTIIRPTQDNNQLIVSVSAVIGPVILALSAMMMQQIHLAVNSRLSELLAMTAASKLAEGKLAGAATVEAKIVEQQQREQNQP